MISEQLDVLRRLGEARLETASRTYPPADTVPRGCRLDAGRCRTQRHPVAVVVIIGILDMTVPDHIGGIGHPDSSRAPLCSSPLNECTDYANWPQVVPSTVMRLELAPRNLGARIGQRRQGTRPRLLTVAPSPQLRHW